MAFCNKLSHCVVRYINEAHWPGLLEAGLCLQKFNKFHGEQSRGKRSLPGDGAGL